MAEYFDVRLADMMSKTAPGEYWIPAPVGMYLARRHTKASLNEIGEAFGAGIMERRCTLIKLSLPA